MSVIKVGSKYAIVGQFLVGQNEPIGNSLLNFYKNSAEPNRVDKTSYLQSLFTLEGTLRESCNIINPSILIEREEFINANYCYIPNFNRYYFIDKITSVRNNLWRIDLSVDVLMTYKEQIKELECFITRQENDNDLMLKDELIPVDVEPIIEKVDLKTNIDKRFYKEVRYIDATQGLLENIVLDVVAKKE